MRRGRAMTLVEVTLALALSTLLAVGALRATTALARSDRAAGQLDAEDVRAAGLERLLEMDLEHALRFRSRPEGLEIQTLARLREGTWEVEHLESAVTYRVERGGSAGGVLLRVQDAGDGRPLVELAARGVRGLSAARPAGGGSASGAGEWQTAADGVAVKVEFERGTAAQFVVRRK